MNAVIAQIVNLAQSLEKDFLAAERVLRESFRPYYCVFYLKNADDDYQNPIAALNQFLSGLREFIDLVEGISDLEEDRNLFKMYREWCGVDISPLPYPSCRVTTVKCQYYDFDEVELIPKHIEIIRKHVESVNAL